MIFEYLVLRVKPGSRWEQGRDELKALAARKGRRNAPPIGLYLHQRKCWLIECLTDDVTRANVAVLGQLRLGRPAQDISQAHLCRQVDEVLKGPA